MQNKMFKKYLFYHLDGKRQIKGLRRINTTILASRIDQ